MNSTALLLVDVQKGFENPVWGQRNNPDAESNIASLLDAWRALSLPVIHVRHNSLSADSPLRPASPGNAYMDLALPQRGEQQFEKSVNSAFIGTGLEDYLHNKAIGSLVIAGLTTDHCVSTTTRMAANLGFDVTLVSDATATFERTGSDGTHYTADEMHKINLVSLDGEFCRVQSTHEILQVLPELPDS